ncbi:glycosyltransferase family 4 protein [Tenacibaculum agarivorans]|uniref:glycosyltransferase family 4 protein n=1 Tax=Tenacibaculum agarivorans TaxID=1908389 RepID=UPI00094BB346|nr:glycosyltransferase family 4 protein [Tenacibaculum agarivorans]
MRILLINNTHYIGGGADRVYINTGSLLEKNGHTVLYFSTQSEKNIQSKYAKYFVSKQNNREVSFTDKLKGVKNYLYNKEVESKLSRLIQEEKPDIAHLHLFYGGLSSAVLKVLRENNIPIVQTVHDYRLLCPANAFLNSKNEICERCKPKKYYNCTLNRCSGGNIFYSSILSVEGYFRKYLYDPLDYINHFVFVSDFSRKKHIDFDKRYREKSSHLYNFTHLQEKPIVERENYFLFFGRLSNEKGVHTLIEAAQEVGVNLKVVGDGPIKEELEINNVNEKISFLGHKSGQELIDLIKKASFIIVPSEWYENNPMTIIESYALGKPVIGAKIGGIPEIIIENKTGFLFESRSKETLKQVIEKAKKMSDQDYLEMSEGARKFAESNFSEEKNYDHLISVYQSLKQDNEKNS